MVRARPRRLLPVLVALALLTGGWPPGAAAAAPGGLLDAPAHGRAAVAGLGDRLPEAAARNHMSPRALRRLLLADHTAWLDRHGRMFYVERAPATTASGGATPPPAPHPYSETFALHSSPGSLHTIYLDFDGATVSGTQWNTDGVSTDPQPPYDTDGDPTSFGTGERDMIQEIWRQVAEDYAPFDVDVTTADPGLAALERTSADDQQYGMRVLLSPAAQAADALCSGSCGGISYVDVFADPASASYQPAWVFTHLQGNTPEYLASTVSHEVGHTFGLHHDGTSTADYYDGNSAWAPIMGGPSWGVSQWSDGEYPDASNTEDDVAVIAAGGAPLRADDVGDTTGTATSLGTDPQVSVPGLISTRADRDVFSMDLGCVGDVHVTAAPESRGADADLSLRVLDASGAPVASADPPVAGDSWSGMSGLDADLTVPVSPGTYYVEVAGAGTGYPAAVGYTDYGSLGRYTLDVGGCTPAAVPDTPTSLTASADYAGRSVTVGWAPPASDGGSPVTGYVVSADPGSGPQTLAADARSHTFTGLERGTSYVFTVSAVNGAGQGPAATRTLVFPTAPPDAPGNVAVVADPATHTMTVSWAAPLDDGGSPVTGYTATAVDAAGHGAATATTDATATSQAFTGLTPGESYTFEVHAVNATGTGPDAASAPVRLPTTPGPVGSLGAALTAPHAVTVTWTAPADDGGTPVTGYRVDWFEAGTGTPVGTATTTAPGYRLSGLVNGRGYYATVAALTDAGPGASARSADVVPATVPARTRVTRVRSGVPGGRITAKVRWRAPGSGGTAITGYRVVALRLNAAGRVVGHTLVTRAASARAATVRLPRKGRYRFTVRAVNRLGAGPASARSRPVLGR